MRSTPIAILACSGALLAAPQYPVLNLPAGKIRVLEGVALEVAKQDLRRDWRELLHILTNLGRDPKAVATLRSRIEKQKINQNFKRLGSLVGRVQRAAAGLAAHLPDQTDAGREYLARMILKLDGSVAGARKIVGHMQDGNRWITPEVAALAPRLAEIAEAVYTQRDQKPGKPELPK